MKCQTRSMGAQTLMYLMCSNSYVPLPFQNSYVSTTAVKLKKELQQDAFHMYGNRAGCREVER